MFLARVLSFSSVLLTASGLEVTKSTRATTANPQSDPVTLPISFHQSLLVCNTCAGWEGVEILKNDAHTKSQQALNSNACRYVDGKIFKQDRISFKFTKEGASGTFVVDDLPDSDSVLLLVVQRRAKTNLLSFQSFAFAPNASNQPGAQVAFLNSVAGDEDTRVRMSDKKSKTSATREEQVLFNRVYSIDAGAYEVALQHSNAGGMKKTLNLARGQDYVVLKTGSKEHPDILVFPDDGGASPLMGFLYAMAALGPLVAGFVIFNVWRNKKGNDEGLGNSDETVTV